MSETTTDTERSHLHQDDCPHALNALRALTHGRDVPGYEPTATGAWVCWDELTTSWLSTTERATAHIIHGCAIVEQHGGSIPPRLLTTLAPAFEAVTR